MAYWFERKEHRRFRRIDMSVKLFVTPSDPINDFEIFALGIDYFPKSVSSKINDHHKKLISWISHIQEQKDILEPVFKQVIMISELLGEAVRQVSEGRNPLLNEEFKQTLMGNVKNIKRIDALEEPAPKTFQYFSEMEKKLTHFLRLLLLSLHKSTDKRYHCFKPERQDFKIDQLTKKFTQEPFSKIPLVQSIYYMNQLINDYCDAFQEMNADYYLREHPEDWQELKVNMSAGGFAAYYKKRFLPGKPLISYIFLSDEGRVMTVKTTFARFETSRVMMAEKNAFYFEFPDPQDQRFLELEIERFELEKALEHYLDFEVVSRAG